MAILHLKAAPALWTTRLAAKVVFFTNSFCTYFVIYTDREGIVFPIDDYEYGSEGIALIGGHMYRGCLHPNLNGAYIFGDFTGYLKNTTYSLHTPAYLLQWSACFEREQYFW